MFLPRQSPLLTGLDQYLYSREVEATISKVPARGSFGTGKADPGVQLTGQSIDMIRLDEPLTDSYGRRGLELHFMVAPRKPLLGEPRKALSAKSEVIKKARFLGIFGGRIVDVTWVGGPLARSLNADRDLLGLLVDYYSAGWVAGNIEIMSVGGSYVDIVSPDATSCKEALRHTNTEGLKRERETAARIGKIAILDSVINLQLYAGLTHFSGRSLKR